MTTPSGSINERLKLSRETLYRWKQMGGPSGKLEDLLRMVGEEILILDELQAQNPSATESIQLLIYAYRSFQSELKERAN